jgi:predicted glycoside hydrolase/deacetylase ChbG (UPF0249 family)
VPPGPPTEALETASGGSVTCLRRGLLIVNLDDWGYEPSTTDSIAECYGRGAVTSTTALVWMRDSARAARIATKHGFSTGLHLNLDLAYEADNVPIAARRVHADVCRYFASSRRRNVRYLFSRHLRNLVAADISAQLSEFEALYGTPPTHVDGHHHVLELAPVGFLSSALPPGTKIRNPFWSAPSLLGGLSLNWHRLFLRWRFTTTDRFFDLNGIHPELGGTGLEDVLEDSDHSSVEIMAHAYPDEVAILQSAAWQEALAPHRLGSYADL